MPLIYTIHNPGQIRQGVGSALPELPPVGGASLNLGDTSVAIQGPCEIRLLPTEALKLDLRKASQEADLDPANSFLNFAAGAEQWFYLKAGSWKMKAVAA